MTYTPAQRKNLCAVFKAAKPLLWNGKRVIDSGKKYYICNALTDHRNTSARYGILATDLISRRLNGHKTLLYWLLANGIERHTISDELMQAHRHAWLDMLIKEFSK